MNKSKLIKIITLVTCFAVLSPNIALANRKIDKTALLPNKITDKYIKANSIQQTDANILPIYLSNTSQNFNRFNGVGYIRSGFHHQGMRQPRALRFFGMKVKTLQIQSTEVKSGFL